MRIGRKAAALALATMATLASGAQAGPTDPSNGGGTGIKDWLSVSRTLSSGHGARALCEYALNPGPTGHFEMSVEAWTGSTFNPSADIKRIDGKCTFEGTATGTLTLQQSTTTAPLVQQSHDQAARRPTRLCANARIEWTNGDVITVNNECKWGRIFVVVGSAAVQIGPNSSTERTIDAAGNGATGCGVPDGRCAGSVQEVVTSVTTDDFQPGVDVSVSTGSGDT